MRGRGGKLVIVSKAGRQSKNEQFFSVLSPGEPLPPPLLRPVSFSFYWNILSYVFLLLLLLSFTQTPENSGIQSSISVLRHTHIPKWLNSRSWIFFGGGCWSPTAVSQSTSLHNSINDSVSVPPMLSENLSYYNATIDGGAGSSKDGYSVLETTIIAVIAGILSLLTILGNVLVMVSFKMDKQLQTISNYFLLSLAGQ